MTITFEVCDNLELEDVENFSSFDIKKFIKEQINKSIPNTTESYNELFIQFKGKGIKDLTEIHKLVNEKIKENNLNRELKIEELFKKINILKSSLDNKDKEKEKEENENLKIIVGYNSFIYSAWEAYNYHHHLEIRPENIWMAIVSQFSFYINKYNKELRNKFVDFNDEKKILQVFTDYSILEIDNGNGNGSGGGGGGGDGGGKDVSFEKLTNDMVDEICKNIKDPSIRDWIIPSFSTTTVSDKIIFSSVLMSTLKKDFIYRYGSKCGLPKVTLLGTVDDWIQLKERSLKLKEFNISNSDSSSSSSSGSDNSDDNDNENLMNKWVDKYLLEILDNFIESSNGKPNKTWWNQIIDFREQSGSSVLSGWLSAFCLFKDDGTFEDNAHLDCPQLYPETKWPKINCISISNGFISTPIQLTDSNGNIYNSQLFSGHFASKIKNNNTLKPSLDWFIISNLDI
ncbi:hypothetical protein ACTFIZ_003718 [Dictyostelium cf. discoideum]